MKKKMYPVMVLVMAVLLAGWPRQIVAAEKASLPDFPVTINGQQYRSDQSSYPLFVYHDITYIPATYYTMRYMGITTEFKDGILYLSRPNVSGSFNDYSSNRINSGNISVIKAKHKLIVLGNEVNDPRYPVMSCREVMYLPLTWELCHDRLGMSYSFTQEKGLVIETEAGRTKAVDGCPVEKAEPDPLSVQTTIAYPVMAERTRIFAGTYKDKDYRLEKQGNQTHIIAIDQKTNQKETVVDIDVKGFVMDKYLICFWNDKGIYYYNIDHVDTSDTLKLAPGTYKLYCPADNVEVVFPNRTMTPYYIRKGILMETAGSQGGRQMNGNAKVIHCGYDGPDRRYFYCTFEDSKSGIRIMVMGGFGQPLISSDPATDLKIVGNKAYYYNPMTGQNTQLDLSSIDH